MPLKATDPLYILYTSGTTGQPKGVVRDNGGHMVALKWSMKAIYDIDPGETFWAASDVGWVVGHSYIVYAPLLHGCASVLYEGKPVGTPDAGAFWRVISEHNVAALFTAPTAFRAIRRDDPDGSFIKKYDLSKFRTLFLAGERADTATHRMGGASSRPPGHRSLVADGDRLVDLRQSGRARADAGQIRLARRADAGLRPAGPRRRRAPGRRRHARQHRRQAAAAAGLAADALERRQALPESYLAEFPGYYKTADAGYKDDDGYAFIMARTDDIINVAGHRLSTGAMEEVLAGHPDVAECAVIGVADQLKGQVPCGFVVLKAGKDARGGGASGGVRRRWCARRSARSPPSASCTS